MSSAALCGCSPAREYSQMSEEYLYVMNAAAELTVYDYFEVNGVEDKVRTAKFQRTADEINIMLRGLDSALSTSYEGSDISRFNAAAAGEKVQIGEDAYNVLSIAKTVCELTEGYYNPAVYYSVQAFGFNGGTPPCSPAELPAEEEISKYVELSGHFTDLSLSREGDKFYARKPDFTVECNGEQISLKVDIGGIGKGYAADKADRILTENGYEYARFNFSSSSVVFKKYPNDGGTFTLGLKNPRPEMENGVYAGPAQYINIPVCDSCVSSSGDYENYYELADENGSVRYCHVFDPFTGKPIESGIMSATVIGGSAAENDALTTAIMAMGAQKAEEFISARLQNRQVVFTLNTGNGYKYYTNIAEGGYELVNQSFSRL